MKIVFCFFQDIIPVFISYYPSGISINSVEHYAQIINNGGIFRQFDYGKDNLLKYNSKLPPEYEVWKISLPVYLFIGREDFLAPSQVRTDLPNLTNITKFDI